MTEQPPITPPPPHLLKKFSAQAQDEAKKRNGAGYLKTFATLCIEWAMNSKTTPNDRQIRSSEIEPSSVLVEQWHMEATGGFRTSDIYIQDIATQAARWGADMELEACCEWLHWQSLATHQDLIPLLRAARRPPTIPETIKVDGHTYRLVK